MKDFKEKLKLVPELPGSYQMKDKNGYIIYVGKAKNLKKRVSSYFRGNVTGKTAMLVQDIDDFEYIVTDSELESLILEINLIKKYDPKYKWHIIGHLQTNKVKYIIGKVEMIESLDSIKLAKEIEKQAAKHDVIQNVLVQIKISKDELKTGLPIEEADSFLKEVSTYPHIKLKGFMCVASHTDNIQLIEEEFSMMNDLYKNYKDLYQLDTLSMGMSNDYELAIKHGSNTVRIGSAIFGARN